MSQAQETTQHTPGPSKAECDLAATQDSINGLSMHLGVLVRRFVELDRVPGGRDALLPEQRIEYDLIGARLTDIPRDVAAIAKAAGQ